MSLFETLGLCTEVMQSLRNMGFEGATPIQEEAIPPAMEGYDLIGQAQTGTGKTAAFGIPMIEKIAKGAGEVKGLVVTPTRELAVQVAEELNTIGQVKGVRAIPIYGGQDINRQIRALKKRPQIIVGTPGRLMDHMRRKTVRLDQVSVAVLDEADEMLNMGFIEDVETILSEVPAERQILLFSATMPKPVQELARRFLNDPRLVKIKSREVTVPNTEQFYIEVNEKQKFDILCRVLDIQSPDSAIIFGRTKRRVDELFEALNRRGYSAEGIHGDLTQAKRDSVMYNFKKGVTEILVATDVAARGLDIDDVTHVFNFDIPQDSDSYIHRIGRTGRLGKPGRATTFVTSREISHLRLIEKNINKTIIRQNKPTMDEALEIQQRLAVEKIFRIIAEEDLSSYRGMAEEILESRDSVSVLAATLKIMTKEPDDTPVCLTAEAPVAKKSPRSFSGRPGERPGSFKGAKYGSWGKSDFGGKPGRHSHGSRNRKKHQSRA